MPSTAPRAPFSEPPCPGSSTTVNATASASTGWKAYTILDSPPPPRYTPRFMQRLARLDLARAALVAAVLELAFDRIAPAITERRPHALELVGQFSRHFSGILCVFVLAWT